MNAEVIRRQYLDAMGITTWASRYQLPHALETPACEWEDVVPQRVTPSQRLHALLDDAQQAAAAQRQAHQTPYDVDEAPVQASSDSSSSPQALRSLLGGTAEEEANTPQEHPPAEATPRKSAPDAEAQNSTLASAPSTKPEPLVFTLSSCCIEGRWLNLMPGEIERTEQALLNNLLGVIAGMPSSSLNVMTFSWPPMANGPQPDDPLEEARDGLNAFISGTARRNGWQLERVLWWGNYRHPPCGAAQPGEWAESDAWLACLAGGYVG
ncbi:hypothetical protein [Vreelandella azerica]|uniref:hypothetical protein n=1 Tax=Vreelandella azerica TaxID=2732867 RepID=UPI001F229A6A|nr:hypothetical protein [Halomonas azerica]